MEHAMPSNKLGIVYGTNMSPQKINPKDASDAVIEKALVKHNARTGKTSSKDIESKIKEQEIIRQGHSFEEVRKKELEHILELAEYSPEVARKYIAVELGESITTPEYQDKYLTEYLNKSKELKQKLNNLQIQLGEFKNDTII
jgi:predicted polyphosphate/ATP-dependent NAD kinase